MEDDGCSISIKFLMHGLDGFVSGLTNDRINGRVGKESFVFSVDVMMALAPC